MGRLKSSSHRIGAEFKLPPPIPWQCALDRMVQEERFFFQCSCHSLQVSSHLFQRAAERLSLLQKWWLKCDIAASRYRTKIISQRPPCVLGLGWVSIGEIEVSHSLSREDSNSPSPVSHPQTFSEGLRYGNCKVIHTVISFSLFPLVQISITQHDKEKMESQSVRLLVFSLMTGAAFNIL